MVELPSFTDYAASIYSADRNVFTGQDTNFYKKSDVGSYCAMGYVTFISKWSRSGGNTIWQHATLGRVSHYLYEAPRSIPNLPKTVFNDIIAVLAGLGIYAAFVLELHQDFFGIGLIG